MKEFVPHASGILNIKNDSINPRDLSQTSHDCWRSIAGLTRYPFPSRKREIISTRARSSSAIKNGHGIPPRLVFEISPLLQGVWSFAPSIAAADPPGTGAKITVQIEPDFPVYPSTVGLFPEDPDKHRWRVRLAFPAAIGTVPSVRPTPATVGFRRAAENSCPPPTSMSSSPFLVGSPLWPCRTRRSSTICCSGPAPKRCSKLRAIPDISAPKSASSACSIPGIRSWSIIPMCIAWSRPAASPPITGAGSTPAIASFSP